jgi:ceramide glucosyltransferase
MTSSSALAVALGAWLAGAAGYQVAAQASLRRLLSRRPGRVARPLPSASILRPLVAGTPGLEENLARLCDLGVPVVAGVDRDETTIVSLARRAGGHAGPGCLTVVTEEGPAGTNRKISKLIVMLPKARGEIVVFTDGDIAVPRGYLEAVLSPFAEPAVGMVTCPYRSVGGGSMATRIDVILTNAGFLPSLALAERLEGMRFAMGATIAIRREALDAIGGLDPLLDLLADDWALADRTRRAGRRIVLAPLLLDHCVGAEGWRAVWRRHLRWARTARAVRPAGFAGTILTHGWLPAVGLTMAGRGVSAASWLVAYALIRVASVAANARLTGLTTGDWLLLPVADTIAIALYFGGLFGRSVRWGRTRLQVRPDGKVRPIVEPPGTGTGHARAALRP